jgi:SAM-dependent methyltransferase
VMIAPHRQVELGKASVSSSARFTRATGFPARTGSSGETCPLCFSANIKMIRHGLKRRLMKCSSCSVAYLDPWPTAPEITGFFAHSYIATDEDSEVRFGTRQEKSLSQVAAMIQSERSKGRILDIGCAGGHFLRLFPKPAWEKYGVELSKHAVAKAREKGITVHEGDIHSARFPAACFDVITALDTFYYFADPRSELAEIRRLLKPGGMLTLVFTCAKSHTWRNRGLISMLLGGTTTSLLESNHLYFYEPDSARYILEASNFLVRSICPWPATGQPTRSRERVFQLYSRLSAVAWRLSKSRWMLGPRFLVTAVPGAE